MTPRVIGLEIEFGVAVEAHGESMPSSEMACDGLMSVARGSLRYLPDSSETGIFLANGARFYQDSGHHPEFCTPEVDHPDDCVRYALACELIMGDLARDLGKKLKRVVLIFRTNIDYTQPDVTWACHESYLHCAATAGLPRQLIAHLVSRLCFCAGGLNPKCPGIEFSLSPRVHNFVTAVSHTTTSRRGIFNTREEPLAAGPYRRLHVICCDSLCSQTALWLRVATTCLVVAMAEGGLEPGEHVQLAHPVAALHRFATDPHFKATAELSDGRRLTALQIQRHYLEVAEAHCGHPCMPAWAGEACRRWRAMLDRLEQGPAAVDRTLDWAIKYTLFRDHVRRRGFDPQSLPHWNHVLAGCTMWS